MKFWKLKSDWLFIRSSIFIIPLQNAAGDSRLLLRAFLLQQLLF